MTYTRAQWDRMVGGAVVFKHAKGTDAEETAMREAILDRLMANPAEGVWHATAQVTGKACWCAVCRPDVRRFA